MGEKVLEKRSEREGERERDSDEIEWQIITWVGGIILWVKNKVVSGFFFL